MYEIAFTKKAKTAYEQWLKIDAKIALKITDLLENIKETPFQGIGKPEPLKHEYAGCWSRRITQEHRLVYRVKEQTVTILQCSGHYDE